MTATPQNRTSIRDSFGPLSTMQIDLTDGSINPLTPISDLVNRYGYDTLTVKRAFRKALAHHGKSNGQVLVMLDPDECRVLAVTKDPATELGSREMIEAGERLFAVLSDTDAHTNLLASIVEPETSQITCLVYSMPTFDYRVTHGAHVADVGVYVCDIGVSL